MDSFTEFTDLSGVVVNSEGGRTWFEFRGLVFQCIGVFACSTKDNGQSCMTQCLTTEINGQTISAGYSQTDLVLDLDANSWSFDSNNFSLHLVGQVVELINQEDVVGQQAAVKELDRVLSAYGVVSGVCTEETEEFVLIGSDDQPLVLVSICPSLPAELQRALAAVFAGAVNMRIRNSVGALNKEQEAYVGKLDELTNLIAGFAAQ